MERLMGRGRRMEDGWEGFYRGCGRGRRIEWVLGML